MEVNLVGDSAETLRALLPLLEEKVDRAWREKVEGWTAEWWKTLEKRALEPAKGGVNPQRSVWELSPRIPSDAIVTSDSGSCANWYARDLKVQRGMMCSLSGGLASMGAAVPYAIAAKFAFPARPVIALVGDGAMQMNNMAELITVSKYWKQWSNPRWICMVLNNQDLNQVTWEQRVTEGDPKFEASQDLPDFPYAEYARMVGLAGVRVDDPDALGAAWDDALTADRPFVLEAVTDPDVPPLPPHITLKQAKAMTFALAKGDPDFGDIVRQTLKDKVSEYLPTR
jgi:pyruvate dehydrogenase (quinone)